MVTTFIMADSRDIVREIVREELAASSSSSSSSASSHRISPPSIYARTQSLIRTAAANVKPSPSLSATPDSAVQEVERIWGHSSRGKRRAQTAHPWRLKPAKSSFKVKPDKSIYVWLLDNPLEDEEVNEFVLQDEQVLLKGYVNINPDETAEEIRNKICSLFRTKFELIGPNDFDYVKRDRNKISCPITSPNFKWDFTSLKSLTGQGKLYAKIKSSYRNIIGLKDEESDDECALPTKNEVMSPLSADQYVFDTATTAVPSSHADKISSSGPSSDRAEHVETLKLLNDVLDKQDARNIKPDLKFKSLKSIVDFFREKLLMEKERLRIDPQYALEEALCNYKSPDFDPKMKLLITYKKQAAVDTGGVLRQFFSDVFTQMCTGCGEITPLFEGKDTRKLPVSNASMELSEIMVLVGKIMAHAFIQSGTGMACLAPAIFTYLCTEDMSTVISEVGLDDVYDPTLIHYVSKINQASTDDALHAIFLEEDFQFLYGTTGMIQMLTLRTRDSILQGLIYHEVIGKRSVALQQIRSGLKLLGFLEVLSKNQKMLEPIFVYSDDYLTSSVLLGIFCYDESKEKYADTHEYFVRFVEECNRIQLERLLIYCTGSTVIPMKDIHIKYSHQDGVFSSTCLTQLKVPVGFKNYDDFKLCFASSLPNNGKAFSSI